MTISDMFKDRVCVAVTLEISEMPQDLIRVIYIVSRLTIVEQYTL
jgi:hypothetical protein